MILEGILDLLPFFLNKLSKSEKSDDISNNNNLELEEKIKEREKLLELIGRRIKKIVQENKRKS